MRLQYNLPLSHLIPKGRIETLDILRGIAIILMTMPHQTYLFGLHTSVVGHQLFIVGAYYTRPLFIAVSGIALALHERKYRWPFRMIVHGGVLFAMAWCVDVVSHQSLSVDWDIFQLIGACYAIAGLLGYCGYDGKNIFGLLGLLFLWYIYPSFRPDEGLFPLWPNGIYFLGGYLIARWAMGRFNMLWSVFGLFMASVVYLFVFYLSDEHTIKFSTNLNGIAASNALIFILLFLTLTLEIKNRTAHFSFFILKRFGQYPLSLYFMQQFVVVFGLKTNFRITLTGAKPLDCLIHTVLLLVCMYSATFLFDRHKSLSIEYWLRKAESAITRHAPQTALFSPLPSKP